MVTITPSDTYLLLNGALLGVAIGIIGNWIVTAFFRLVPNTRGWSAGLLLIGFL